MKQLLILCVLSIVLGIVVGYGLFLWTHPLANPTRSWPTITPGASQDGGGEGVKRQ